MNEKLFQFIWEYALFDTTDLHLQDGRSVTILRQGLLNRNAGPDFTHARIRVDQTIWAGNIELHLKESDWVRHGHEHNRQYQNIILHVVLEADGDSTDGDFPVLSLSGRIKQQLLNHYQTLMQQQQPIACAPFRSVIPELTWMQWSDRLLHERWEQKIQSMQAFLSQTKGDWNQLLYVQMARYFGAAVNTDAFRQLAEATPFSILARHRDNLSHLEALLFGQAGLLPAKPQDAYTRELSIHYAFFRQKYGLRGMDGHVWKFMRMRPAHFPTIRIAQFAMLIHKSHHLFTRFINADLSSVREAQSLLHVPTSTYWEQHYVFDKASGTKQKTLGGQMVRNLLINVIVPMRILYNRHMGHTEDTEAMATLLRTLPAEKNHITTQWEACGFSVKDAYTSQALIQLYEHYCVAKRCLRCAAGLAVLKK